MSVEVIALLDKPSPSALGMVPFVVRDQAGTLEVRGLRNRPRNDITREELDELVATGSALALPDAIPRPGDHSVVAGWIGEDFRRQVARLGAPGLPAIPVRRHVIADQGEVWFDAPARIYGLMDGWTKEAATDVFGDRGGRAGGALAELMLWVLPDREETRAAVWHTRSSDEDKARHLQWYARLARDAGEPISEAALEARFRDIAEQYRTPVKRCLDALDRKPPRRAPRRARPFFDTARATRS